MEAVLFIGLPASGKSSFFKQRFFPSHVRISLDLLRTRCRERRWLQVCLETQQRFVVDNTNPSRQERIAYIHDARQSQFKVTGFYFQSRVEDCRRRNAQRPEGEMVPDVAILASAKKLELPALAEGFDQLFYVRLSESGFEVEEWRDAL